MSEKMPFTASVLVIGGAGFCGAHLCQELLQRNWRVAVLDKLIAPNSYFQHSHLSEKTEILRGDICDFDFLQTLFAKRHFDFIFHLAAQPIVAVSNAQPLETARVNILGTYNILEAIRQAGSTPSGKMPALIFASSGAYYGATQTNEPIVEDAPALTASNIYAPTKAAADLAVRCYAKTYGLRAATCRWMNTYGPGDTNFSRIVPSTIRRLQNGERALIDGTNGSNILEMLHVRDMVSAYLKVAENIDNKSVCGQAFNFGSGAPLTLLELVAQIVRSWNFETGETRDEAPLITGPPTESVKYLDISKSQNLLGWQPQISLQNGLRETVRWYREGGRMKAEG